MKPPDGWGALVDTAPKVALGQCGHHYPKRRTGPSGRALPVDRCNRLADHEGPHRVYNGRTFAIELEWEAGAS